MILYFLRHAEAESDGIIQVSVGGAEYVLEIAVGQTGPFPPPNPGLGAGRLVRQCHGGSPEVLLDGFGYFRTYFRGTLDEPVVRQDLDRRSGTRCAAGTP